MKNKVLIISHREGFEADHVIDELRDRSVDVFRFNTDDGDVVSKISFDVGEKVKLLLECDGRCLDVDDVKAAWLQQGYPYSIDSIDPIISLQRASLIAAYNQIENGVDCKWLNKPSKVSIASNKILQLNVAKECDMQVPETLISNNPNHIETFCKEPSIMKNLNTPWFYKDEKFKAAYTRVVTDDIFRNKDALEFAPIIYQKIIEKKEEVRVAMIGDNDFAVSSSPSKESIDIRELENTGENFRATEFPMKEKEKLLTFMNKLDVNSCGADYLVDNDGNYIFLEANMSGAWWWIDKHYDGKIKRAITDYLIQ